ncbi:uncharacterized protein LOC107261422 [Ricinus communis]|uniref:uncharacterized protein LOC107261422 n=1 Tax=Ricinus communis TaxID=3988 RepID=UPI00201AF240|nr:uncharacterized protein LOC107261422 [Ricinus communis]
MGELKFFLRLQIKQCKDDIFINKSKYTKKLLRKFEKERCKIVKTPMSTSIKLGKDEKGKLIDEKKYKDMISSLLCLIASRPDTMCSACAHFQSSPKEFHLHTVKRTMHLGLWYPKDTSFDITGFSNPDYASSLLDRKSTSRTCHFLGECLFS